MYNSKNDHAQKTEKLILSVMDYCKKNDLKIWSGQSTFFSKYYVGTEEDLKTAQKSPFAQNLISELREEDIIYNNHYFIYHPGNNEKNITIDPYIELIEDNEDMRLMHLYISVFLKNDNEIMKHFANDWFRRGINLTHALEYKDEEYPKGFLDEKIILYDSGKNWYHFLESLDKENLVKFWENEENLEKFAKKLKELNPDGKHYVEHSFLKKITDKLCEVGLSEDAKLKTSYMLMDVLPEEFHKGYTTKFPFLQNLIDAKNKDSLFLQNDEEITEKCLFSKNNIYEYFKFANLKASQYENIAIQALRFIGENQQLLEKGLICANVFTTDNELLLFATLNDNRLINKQSIKSLFISSLETFFNHKEVVLTNNHNGVDNREILRKVINTSIEHWILKEELSKTVIEKSPKKLTKL